MAAEVNLFVCSTGSVRGGSSAAPGCPLREATIACMNTCIASPYYYYWPVLQHVCMYSSAAGGGRRGAAGGAHVMTRRCARY